MKKKGGRQTSLCVITKRATDFATKERIKGRKPPSFALSRDSFRGLSARGGRGRKKGDRRRSASISRRKKGREGRGKEALGRGEGTGNLGCGISEKIRGQAKGKGRGSSISLLPEKRSPKTLCRSRAKKKKHQKRKSAPLLLIGRGKRALIYSSSRREGRGVGYPCMGANQGRRKEVAFYRNGWRRRKKDVLLQERRKKDGGKGGSGLSSKRGKGGAVLGTNLKGRYHSP